MDHCGLFIEWLAYGKGLDPGVDDNSATVVIQLPESFEGLMNGIVLGEQCRILHALSHLAPCFLQFQKILYQCRVHGAVFEFVVFHESVEMVLFAVKFIARQVDEIFRPIDVVAVVLIQAKVVYFLVQVVFDKFFRDPADLHIRCHFPEHVNKAVQGHCFVSGTYGGQTKGLCAFRLQNDQETIMGKRP